MVPLVTEFIDFFQSAQPALQAALLTVPATLAGIGVGIADGRGRRRKDLRVASDLRRQDLLRADAALADERAHSLAREHNQALQRLWEKNRDNERDLYVDLMKALVYFNREMECDRHLDIAAVQKQLGTRPDFLALQARIDLLAPHDVRNALDSYMMTRREWERSVDDGSLQEELRAGNITKPEYHQQSTEMRTDNHQAAKRARLEREELLKLMREKLDATPTPPAQAVITAHQHDPAKATAADQTPAASRKSWRERRSAAIDTASPQPAALVQANATTSAGPGRSR